VETEQNPLNFAVHTMLCKSQKGSKVISTAILLSEVREWTNVSHSRDQCGWGYIRPLITARRGVSAAYAMAVIHPPSTCPSQAGMLSKDSKYRLAIKVIYTVFQKNKLLYILL